MIFRREAADQEKEQEKPSKKPTWGPQGAGTQSDSKSNTGPKGNNKEETDKLEEFQKNNPWVADVVKQSYVLINKKEEAGSNLGAAQSILDTDEEQCQVLDFVPSYMSACTIAQKANDITKNVSIEKVNQDYQDYKNQFKQYLQASQALIDFRVRITDAAKVAQSSNVDYPALSEVDKKLAAASSENKQKLNEYYSITRKMDILLNPGPSGKSILDCYQEIIDLGTEGCKICQDAAPSFNTTPGLGPVTAYVNELISIYAQIANIYRTELAPAYSLIAASSGNSASKAKIQNTVALLSTRIPQAYANEILKAKYALMIGKTYGTQDQRVRGALEKFLEVSGGAASGAGGASGAAPGATTVKSK
jgi:hypothetical protein